MSGDDRKPLAEIEWKGHLMATPECIPLDQLDAPLNDVQQEHVAACVRCESELRLWQAMQQDPAAANDGAAVPWIAAELRRRHARGEIIPAAGDLSDPPPPRQVAVVDRSARGWRAR